LVQRDANERVISSPGRNGMSGSPLAATSSSTGAPVPVRLRHHTLRSGEPTVIVTSTPVIS
jgi:hypothetical protein